MKSCQLLGHTLPKSHIFADGNKSWASHSMSLGRKCFQVIHVKMEFTRKTRKRGHKTHGTQCTDKKWSALKRYIPKELCSKAPNGLLNEKIAEYVYSFVWRSNTLGKHQLKDLGKLAHKTLTA